MRAVLISAQFLVQLPDDVSTKEAEAFGVDWLSGAADGAIDYRHPHISGVFIRPVPVEIKDPESDDIFQDSNLMQL